MDDSQICTYYVSDIYEYLHQIEVDPNKRPLPDYIEKVVKTEADILKSLKFELGNPTVKTFFRRFTRVAQEDYKVFSLQLQFLGYYFAELSLLDYGCVKFLPSMVDASFIFLTRFIIRPKRHPWSFVMQQYSGYKASNLKECVLIIHDLYLSRRGGALQAILTSYFEDVQEVDISYVEDVQVVTTFEKLNGKGFVIISTRLRVNPPYVTA
ncbi:hypothetical protein REPUB_Repub02eG0057200 [Reevesia pubescens]